MRPGPLLAALLLIGMPSASAAGNELTLSGPDTLMLTGAKQVPLGVALSLDKVVCTEDAEVPVLLRIAHADGARASLATERLVFRIPAHAAAARPWVGEAQTVLTIAPLGAGSAGLVQVLAHYALPAQCSTLGGAREGEASHAIGFAMTLGKNDALAPLKAIATVPAQKASEISAHWGIQASLALMAAGALAIVVKRIRWRPSPPDAGAR